MSACLSLRQSSKVPLHGLSCSSAELASSSCKAAARCYSSAACHCRAPPRLLQVLVSFLSAAPAELGYSSPAVPLVFSTAQQLELASLQPLAKAFSCRPVFVAAARVLSRWRQRWRSGMRWATGHSAGGRGPVHCAAAHVVTCACRLLLHCWQRDVVMALGEARMVVWAGPGPCVGWPGPVHGHASAGGCCVHCCGHLYHLGATVVSAPACPAVDMHWGLGRRHVQPLIHALVSLPFMWCHIPASASW